MSPPRSNRRRRKNRRRFGMLFKLLSLLAVVVAITVGATVFFQVEEVLVTGNARYTPQEIIDVSGIQTGDNLFRLNKKGIARTLLESLPYIQSVSLQLRLPNGIQIRVEEWDAVGQVVWEEQSWLISVGGKLLEEGGRTGAIQISGITPLVPRTGTTVAVSQEETIKLSSLLSLLAALEERGTITKATYIDLSAPGQIEAGYSQFVVKLPYGADYVYKLRALEAAVEDKQDYQSGTMDLTQENWAVSFSPR